MNKIGQFLGGERGGDRREGLLWAALLGFPLAALLIGRLVFSDFSILDDHQIIAWQGQDFLARIQSTEIVQFGHSARFRPLMYLVLCLESWLFGANPLPYHVIRILQFAVFFWAVAWASLRVLGFAGAIIVLFAVASADYWGNIWTHSLFASEQITSLGFGVMLFAAVAIGENYLQKSKAQLNGPLVLFSLGVLICIGSKENFLPLVVLNVCGLLWVWKQRKIDIPAAVACMILVSFQLTILYEIVVSNMGRPSDIYGENLSFISRFTAVFHNRHFLLWPAASIMGGFVSGLWGWYNRKAITAEEGRKVALFAMLLLMAGLYVCWEQFFYGGQLPTGNRYDFPSQLIRPFLLAAVLSAILFATQRHSWLKSQFSPLALQIFLLLLLLSVAIHGYDRGNLLPIREAVRVSNEHTGMMRADLAKVRAETAQHPDWPVIVAANHPMDYEAVVTMPLWLHYSGVMNSAYVTVLVPRKDIKSILDKSLTGTMLDVQEKGLPPLYRAESAQEQAEQKSGHCYIVSFAEIATPCKMLSYHPSGYFPVD